METFVGYSKGQCIFDDKGDLIYLDGIILDITDRKQAEEELRLKSEIIENMNEGVFLVGMNDRLIKYTNPKFEQIFGYDPEELLGQHVAIVNAPTDKDPAEKAKSILAVLEKTGRWEGEIENIKKDGTHFWSYVIISVFEHSKYGKVTIAVHAIITDRKIAEEEKFKLEEQLRQAQKMEAIGTLAGGIAHQFNNALSGIIGNIELLEEDLSGDKNLTEYTENIKVSSFRMAKLAKMLLAYARGGKYQEKIVSGSDLIRDSLPLIKNTIKQDINIDTDIPAHIFFVRADVTQIQMVLSAILSNASEAIEGKGLIRITCKNKVISDKEAKDFPDLKAGNYVFIKIEDDGQGMDEDTKNRLFEPFFTTKFTGRGLGMAAAYGTVKNHNGSITIDSKIGQGTTVSIYLPAVKVLEKVPEMQKTEIISVKDTGTILVIEDEEILMDITTKQLEKIGYRVLSAETGKKAIKMAKTFDGDIDLAILDMILPDISGKEIYRQIKKARPGLKVIICSGYLIDGPAREVLDEGAEDFIQKPFRIADLSEKMRKVLGSGS